ncbi:Resolvase, N terminal domain [Rhodococcus maanshanensis]|uniref:Resolvase, N terminal domain n=1 Tax=Rhodococcus maanshanensis TaxID=183556 RepID=A0A1H7YG73_9NOCA|nr:Resolvase, N terminal domain [Rhodococcus maanshanensis]
MRVTFSEKWRDSSNSTPSPPTSSKPPAAPSSSAPHSPAKTPLDGRSQRRWVFLGPIADRGHRHIDCRGKLIFHIFGALADFERSLIRERTVAGLAAARDRGRVGGRPAALSPAKMRLAKKMRAEGTPMAEIAEVLEVARSTLYPAHRVSMRERRTCKTRIAPANPRCRGRTSPGSVLRAARGGTDLPQPPSRLLRLRDETLTVSHFVGVTPAAVSCKRHAGPGTLIRWQSRKPTTSRFLWSNYQPRRRKRRQGLRTEEALRSMPAAR